MWGQAVEVLCERDGLSVKTACKLFGHCRQAFYQFRNDFAERMRRERQIVKAVNEIRQEDAAIGGYKLWLMIQDMFDEDWIPGRDRFFNILRNNKLMLKRPKPRHTTNSNHRFHKYKNLIMDYKPLSPNRLWVSDITYVDTSDGCSYLHLVTDAYSHKIVGWCLSDTLQARHTLEALDMAIEQSGSNSLEGLIHHSDRGVQYCCNAYVDRLNECKIGISMTEDYKPTDNAIAERTNGIIKSELIYPNKRFSNIEEARGKISRFIDFYNERRPHMSIGMKTPSQVHAQDGPQNKMWKNYYQANTVV